MTISAVAIIPPAASGDGGMAITMLVLVAGPLALALRVVRGMRRAAAVATFTVVCLLELLAALPGAIESSSTAGLIVPFAAFWSVVAVIAGWGVDRGLQQRHQPQDTQPQS